MSIELPGKRTGGETTSKRISVKLNYEPNPIRSECVEQIKAIVCKCVFSSNPVIPVSRRVFHRCCRRGCVFFLVVVVRGRRCRRRRCCCCNRRDVQISDYF